jgi:hypothetical protein
MVPHYTQISDLIFDIGKTLLGQGYWQDETRGIIGVYRPSQSWKAFAKTWCSDPNIFDSKTLVIPEFVAPEGHYKVCEEISMVLQEVFDEKSL